MCQETAVNIKTEFIESGKQKMLIYIIKFSEGRNTKECGTL